MRSILAFFALLAGCAGAAPYRPTAFSVKVSGEGPPVVFIPAAATGGEIWDGTVQHLGGKVQAHVITIAGFAGEPPAKLSGPILTEVRTQLARYLRERKLRAVIVGHSLGAFVAWWLAQQEPDVVKAVVAVDAPPYGMALEAAEATAKDFEPMARQISEGIRNAPPAALAAQAKERFATMISDPAQVERVSAAGSRSTPAVLADALYQLFTTDLRPDAAKIRAPSLVLVSKKGVPEDKWPAYEAAWHAQIDPLPDHEMIVFPAARHFIMLDAPEEMYRALD